MTGYPLDTSNGKIHQFNVTIERQIHDVGLRLSYVGSHDYGMNYPSVLTSRNRVPIPFTASRRPYPQVINAPITGTWRAEVQRHDFRSAAQDGSGLQLDAHWTWASNYDNTQNVENPYGPRLWERDPYTPRHRVVLSAVWQIPVGKGQQFLSSAPRVVNAVLGDWQLYWIGYLETGHYFSPTFSGSDPSNTNTSGGRPDRICNGNLPSDQRDVNHWFDAGCFVVPPAGRFGNAGANVLEGPGYNMQNVSILEELRAYRTV